MLRLRVITALVLAPLFILALFLLPATSFSLLLGMIVLGGAWEWGRLSGLHTPLQLVSWLLLVAGLLAAAKLWFPAVFTIGLASAWWVLMAMTLILGRRRGLPRWSAGGRLLIGVVVLVPAWQALTWLHVEDRLLVLCVLLVVWAADTGAYFTGRSVGRHKLAPAVSPGKTVEGTLGGLAAVMAAAVVFWWLIPALSIVGWVALCIVTCLASVVGDLTESHLKRLAGAKDSGTSLPGHGGVLDRIDSITAAAPVFASGWVFLAGEGG